MLRLRHDPRGADRALRLAVRGRDRARQDPGLRPHRPHLPQPVRRRPPVPREHRRLRHEEGVRVDADRGRQARAAHGQEAGAGDPRGDRGARLRPPAAGADPALHDQGRLRRRGDAPQLHPGRRPRRLAPAPGARVRQRPRRGREPFPNARRSANWTCVGLCAHESALKGGELVRLPEFTLRPRPSPPDPGWPSLRYPPPTLVVRQANRARRRGRRRGDLPGVQGRAGPSSVHDRHAQRADARRAVLRGGQRVHADLRAHARGQHGARLAVPARRLHRARGPDPLVRGGRASGSHSAARPAPSTDCSPGSSRSSSRRS